MAFLKAEDAISGKQGKAFVTINGRVEELFYAKTVEATIEKRRLMYRYWEKPTSAKRQPVGLGPEH